LVIPVIPVISVISAVLGKPLKVTSHRLPAGQRSSVRVQADYHGPAEKPDTTFESKAP
jgi:hypothetical protein